MMMHGRLRCLKSILYSHSVKISFQLSKNYSKVDKHISIFK